MRKIQVPSLPLLDPLIEAGRKEGFRFLERLRSELAQGVCPFDGPGETFFGAFANGVLIGIGGLTRDPYTTAARIGRVRHVYVLPDQRRRGVGRGIVEAVEQHANEYFDILRLRTDTVAGANFYQRLGFRRCTSAGSATHWRAVAR